jgi:hypothetical protein
MNLRTTLFRLLMLGCIVLPAAGCNQRVLRWTVSDPQALAPTKRVVLVEPRAASSDIPLPPVNRTFASELAAELTARGYEVSVMQEPVEPPVNRSRPPASPDEEDRVYDPPLPPPGVEYEPPPAADPDRDPGEDPRRPPREPAEMDRLLAGDDEEARNSPQESDRPDLPRPEDRPGAQLPPADGSAEPTALRWARQSGADLLVEFALHASPEAYFDYPPHYTVGVYHGYGYPYRRHGPWFGYGYYGGPWGWYGEPAVPRSVTWDWSIQAAAVRFYDVRSRRIVATASVNYRQETSGEVAIAQDLLMVLDAAGQGRLSGQVRLSDDPGQWPEDDDEEEDDEGEQAGN